MRYAYVENGAVVWERDYDAIDPDAAERKNILPVTVEDAPVDPLTQILSVPVDSIENGAVVRRRTAVERPLDEARARKRTEINRRRDARIRPGLDYAFPDGSGLVSLEAQDQRNIDGLFGQATYLDRQGETGAVIRFRDDDDATHMLTPQQFIVFAQTVLARVEAIYAASWAMKDALNAAATTADVRAVDIDSGWPA